MDKNVLVTRTHKLLVQLGILPDLKGYNYITSAVEILYDDFYFNMGECHITKDLYPRVAKIYHTDWKCVERCVRHAIESIFWRTDAITLEEVFGSTADASKGKLTNKAFLCYITEYIVERE